MVGTMSIGFVLQPKKIGKLDVAGLSKFSVYPHGEGLGTKALRLIESVADPLPVVGFAEPNVLGFYEKCDWYIGRMIDGKYLVSSDPIDDSKFNGIIW